MMKCVIVSTFLLAAIVYAEPPPSSYLPPQGRNFNANFGAQQQQQQPRTNYGPPQRNAQASPRSQYGPPQQQQPQRNNFAAQAVPRNQYGPPAQQQQQQQQLSTNYGVPSAQDFNNFDNQRANSYQQAPSSQYGVPSDSQTSYSAGAAGYSASGPSAGGYSNGGYEEPAKYEFQYDVQDEIAALDFGHKEQRDGSVATGKYYVLLPDGRKQIVNYIADENGYRPTITYEDTGRYNNNAQQGGYDSNAQQGGFGGY